MSKINVSISEIRNAVTALTELNGNFKTKVTELGSLESELGGMWQSEANNAFRTAFSSDREQWNTFSQLVDQYIQTLSGIADGYERAEEDNVTTAKNRSY